MPLRLRVLTPSRRLVSSLLVLPALVIGTLAFSPMTPASALPADGPTVTVTEAGAPASALVAGDLATVTQSAPITAAGQTGQTFESTWDTTQASLGRVGSPLLRAGRWTTRRTARRGARPLLPT